VFKRDAQACIAQITDPDGNNLLYQISDTGDLQYFAPIH
jgi:hypothetical protein